MLCSAWVADAAWVDTRLSYQSVNNGKMTPTNSLESEDALDCARVPVGVSKAEEAVGMGATVIGKAKHPPVRMSTVIVCPFASVVVSGAKEKPGGQEVTAVVVLVAPLGPLWLSVDEESLRGLLWPGLDEDPPELLCPGVDEVPELVGPGVDEGLLGDEETLSEPLWLDIGAVDELLGLPWLGVDEELPGDEETLPGLLWP